MDWLYATQTAEGHAQLTASAARLEDRTVLALVKKSGLEDLAKKVVAELIQ